MTIDNNTLKTGMTFIMEDDSQHTFMFKHSVLESYRGLNYINFIGKIMIQKSMK